METKCLPSLLVKLSHSDQANTRLEERHIFGSSLLLKRTAVNQSIKRTLQSLSACLYCLLLSMQMVASLLQTVHLHSSQQSDAQGKGASEKAKKVEGNQHLA